MFKFLRKLKESDSLKDAWHKAYKGFIILIICSRSSHYLIRCIDGVLYPEYMKINLCVQIFSIWNMKKINYSTLFINFLPNNYRSK